MHIAKLFWCGINLPTVKKREVVSICLQLMSDKEQAMATHSSTLCLENPMDGGAWWAAIHGVAGSRTRLSDFTFTFCFHALEREMATHSSVLAWGIPGIGEPGGLPSMGSHRVGHNWSDLAAAAAAMSDKTHPSPYPLILGVRNTVCSWLIYELGLVFIGSSCQARKVKRS